MKALIFSCSILLITLSACAQGGSSVKEGRLGEAGTNVSGKIVKTDKEWRELLTPEEYAVLRQQGTEAAFTGKYFNHKKEGIYTCAACGNELFSSKTKFRSGTGWPSFYEPVSEQNVGIEEDRAYGMVRTEVHCAKCDGHLGHVFKDGPNPTGLRYCINSVSLDFKGLKE